jgi:hypothetical protein
MDPLLLKRLLPWPVVINYCYDHVIDDVMVIVMNYCCRYLLIVYAVMMMMISIISVSH